MAITRVDFPTAGGSAAFPSDYNKQNAYLTALSIVSAQGVYRSVFDNIGATTLPEIKVGTYIFHGGLLYLVDTADYTIGGSTVDLDDNYIRLVASVSGDTLTASWIQDISSYSYNQAYNGWYDSNGYQVLPEYVAQSGSSYEKRVLTLNAGQDLGTGTKVDDLWFAGDVYNRRLERYRPVNFSSKWWSTPTTADLGLGLSDRATSVSQIGWDKDGTAVFVAANSRGSSSQETWNFVTSWASGTNYVIKVSGIRLLDLRRKTHRTSTAISYYWRLDNWNGIKIRSFIPNTSAPSDVTTLTYTGSVYNDLTTFGPLVYPSDPTAALSSSRAMTIDSTGYLRIFVYNGTTISASNTWQFSANTVRAVYDGMDIEWLREDLTHDYFAYSWLESSPSSACYFAVVKVAKADNAFTVVQGPTVVPRKVDTAAFGAKICPIADWGFVVFNGENTATEVDRLNFYVWNGSTYELLSDVYCEYPWALAAYQYIYLSGCRVEEFNKYGFAVFGRYSGATGQARKWIPDYSNYRDDGYLTAI